MKIVFASPDGKWRAVLDTKDCEEVTLVLDPDDSHKVRLVPTGDMQFEVEEGPKAGLRLDMTSSTMLDVG